MSRFFIVLLGAGLAAFWAGVGHAQPAPHAALPDAFRHLSDSDLASLASGKGSAAPGHCYTIFMI